jgi:hypothetical protein
VEKQLFHLSRLSLLELNRPQSQTRGFHPENKSQYLKKITIEKLNFSFFKITALYLSYCVFLIQNI